MNRRADISGFVSKVRAATARTFDAQAAQSVTNVQESLATPHPPASSPGEPPHLRTGNLRDGVSHRTTVDGNTVTATVGSDRAGGNPLVPFWLEHGTEHMAARPFMGPERAEAGPRTHAAHAEELRSIRP